MAPQIKHIAIFAKDQLKMVEFYKTTFGMEQVHQHDSEGDKSRQAYYLSDGHINLAILPAGDREEGIDHFGFEIEDFEATARTAMAAGASEAPKEVPQDGRFAEGFIRDPVGTRIDLSQRGWLTKSVG
jgi:catechol 2,3-dioxygenase-like lactoylglutathione lyase family enzyme